MDIEKELEKYKLLKEQLEPKIQELKELEIAIKNQLLAMSNSLPIEVSGVKCSFRNGYTRSSWDNKSLRGYAAAHPEILEFVKESTVEPSIVLKIIK